MEMNIKISTRKELESRIKNCTSKGKVTEARVSTACNERIMRHDGKGVNGLYIDSVAVVVLEGQKEDLHCVGISGK